MSSIPWHSLSASEALTLLQSAPEGLTSAEAARRLAEYGPNDLRAPRSISAWTILLRRLTDARIIILLIAAALLAIAGQSLAAVAATIVALLIAALGFVRDHHAQRAAALAHELAAPITIALRDGNQVEVPIRNLVPGDVILIRAGDRIPADARLIEAPALQTDESALTGAPVPVGKHTVTFTAAQLPLHKRGNMVYAAPLVTRGRGRAVVVATGASTEFGRMAQSSPSVGEDHIPGQPG